MPAGRGPSSPRGVTVRTEGDTVLVELAIVLHDCTMADVLLGLGEEDAWLAVQLKTTGGAKKTKANSWEFC